MQDKRKILVTGVPGWLGTYFLRALKKGTSDYPEYSPKPWKIRTLSLPGVDTSNIEENVDQIVRGDIRDFNLCLKATQDVEVVVHLAGVIHPKRVKDFYEVNTKGTSNLVYASILNNVDQFIYISSNSAFGVADYIMNEESPPRPYMNYGWSKFYAEEVVRSFGEHLPYVILRPCWYYGEGHPLRQSKLIKMIEKGRPLIFGDGNYLRSMTYIGNLSMAIIQVISERLYNREYWIADKRPYTINEIYSTIARILGVNCRPIYIPEVFSKMCRLGDKVLQRLGMYNSYLHVAGEMTCNIACSVKRAMKEFGYDPRVDLEEGMRRSIEWEKHVRS